MIAGRFEMKPAASQHAGLYLDKFVPQDKDPRSAVLHHEWKLDHAVYKAAFKRWKSHWDERAKTGAVVCARGRVRQRLAVGLGASSVLETGLRLHFIYGTPIIPGSSIKGVLLRGMPEEHRSHATGERSYEWYLFGDADKPGRAIFHDAWWIPEAKSPLTVDVVTPHHRRYYQSRSAPPTDRDDPEPIQFLAVTGRFLFIIEAPTVAWMEYLRALLNHTLLHRGVGAKTSLGYGSIDLE